MTTTTTTGMRRCIGSTTFGIEAHEAPVDDFPVQASAKDGLGRMCRPHWTEYTRALRKASVARKATEVAEAVQVRPNYWRIRFGLAPRGSGKLLDVDFDQAQQRVVGATEVGGAAGRGSPR